MDLSSQFEDFFREVSSWTQPAKKGYRADNVKHISMKIIDFCARGKGNIVVFGDKDADGIFSSMIMATYLRRLMQIYQEERFNKGEIGVDIRYSNIEKDGFGLTKERYDELSEKYSLIVTTDNGTSADFHTYSIGNLIVVDHHPLNEGEEVQEVPYILNPNVWRKDNLIYSTSGGLVAYDLVKFIDKVLREQGKQYKAYLKDPNNHVNHERMLEVLKEFAGFSLISDMALLDKFNRRFVVEAFSTAKQKSDAVPLYGFFKDDFSQNALSFNINPKINIHRMDALTTINKHTGKTYMESFIAPKTFKEFKEAKTFIEKVNDLRKEITRRERNRILKEVDTESNIVVALCDASDVRIGLSGLIANNLSKKFNKPAIVAVPTRDKTRLSFSGRGENVKSLMLKVLPHVGGHDEASGGSYPLEKDADIAKVFAGIEKKFKLLDIPKKNKKQIINEPNTPLSVDEVFAMAKEFKSLSQGVETTENMLISVYGARVIGEVKKEWGTISLKGDGYKDIQMLINTTETPLEALKEDKIFLVSVKANGTFSLEDSYSSVESYLANVEQNNKSVPFKIASEINDLHIQTESTTTINELASLDKIKRDDLYINIFYASSETIYNAGEIEHTIVIVPSYENERNPLRKREDTLELFISEEKGTESAESWFKQNIIDFLGVASQRTAKGNNNIVVQNDIFELLNENQSTLLKMVLKNISTNIENLKDFSRHQQQEQGVKNEQDQLPLEVN